jgi:hypothetical protein
VVSTTTWTYSNGLLNWVTQHVNTANGTSTDYAWDNNADGTLDIYNWTNYASGQPQTVSEQVYSPGKTLIRSFLVRPADHSGIIYWSGQLDHVGRATIAALLTHSAEYYQTNVIRPAYSQFLGRAADQAGLDFWTAQLQNGMTDEQMQAGFIASPEFYANANNSATAVSRSPAADRLWVDALYQSLLGRGSDQSGADFWTNQLQGTQTLLQVANGFTGSTEGLSVRIQQTYERYLGRGADPAGLAFWLSQYKNGAVNEDIVTGFVSSDEFFQQATM